MVSVRTASLVYNLIITAAILVSFAFTIAFGIFVESQISAWYVLIPLCFIVLGTTLYLTFNISTTRWLIWTLKSVNDVCELERFLLGSAWGEGSVHKLQKNHPKAYAEIMTRFAEYKFADDDKVASETVIYNRKMYQSWPLMSVYSITLWVFWLFLFHYGNFEPALLILLAIVVGIAVYDYNKIKDRSAQITLNESGITLHENFIGWSDIEKYDITRGETVDLRITHSGNYTEAELDYLNISKAQLNHLMFVYLQRHRKATRKSC